MKRLFNPVGLLIPVLFLVLLGFFFSSRRNQQRNQDLYIAAMRGDATKVQKIIEQGATPNSYGKGEFSPLHIAAIEGHDNVVQTLLSHGADVNMPSLRHQITPLLMAVKRGRVSTIKILLSKGADPNRKNKRGHTPLSTVLSIQRVPSERHNPNPKFRQTEHLIRQAGGRE